MVGLSDKLKQFQESHFLKLYLGAEGLWAIQQQKNDEMITFYTNKVSLVQVVAYKSSSYEAECVSDQLVQRLFCLCVWSPPGAYLRNA